MICALLPELRHYAATTGVEVFACGVGPVEAAAETARKLARGPYAAVINAGIAGAWRGSARIGDAVAIADETLADLGLEGGGALTLPGGAQLIARAKGAPELLARSAEARLPARRGLTVAQVTTTDATAHRLRERYETDVESMEGFSVLRAAALAGVPALEVRGISNYVGARSTAEWDFDAGARAAAAGLGGLIARLGTLA